MTLEGEETGGGDLVYFNIYYLIQYLHHLNTGVYTLCMYTFIYVAYMLHIDVYVSMKMCLN